MEEITLRKFWVLCLVILVVSIVGIKGDEVKNGTSNSQGNGTLETLSSYQGQIEKEKGKQNSSFNEVVFDTSKGSSWYSRGGNGGSGGGFRWGWGGGGGGGGGGGRGWGWGGGGGGGGWWKWGCGGEPRHVKGKRGVRSIRHNNPYKKGRFNKEDYRLGEFAQCMARTRCRGMRLDCPLHCGGPCLYDCRYMCKAHCHRD